MAAFYLSYVGPGGSFEGAAVVEARDPILARREADAADLNPGFLCTVDRLDMAGVPPDLVGRRLTRADVTRLLTAAKKPAAPSVRRKAKQGPFDESIFRGTERRNAGKALCPRLIPNWTISGAKR
jgi:hypothetical protein